MASSKGIVAANAARELAPRCGALNTNQSEEGDGRERCQHLAGFRTVHPGQGRCYRHGGLQDGDKRLTHGRYSMERGGIEHPTIGALYEQFRDDPDPTGLFDELALLRALVINFINEYTTTTEALLAWHSGVQGIPRTLPSGLVSAMERAVDLWTRRQKETDDWSPEYERAGQAIAALFTQLRDEEKDARPRKVKDIGDAAKILEDIGKMADRVETMRSRNAISEPELNRIINAMGRVVDVLIPDSVIPPDTDGTALKMRIREGWIGIVTR